MLDEGIPVLGIPVLGIDEPGELDPDEGMLEELPPEEPLGIEDGMPPPCDPDCPDDGLLRPLDPPPDGEELPPD